MGRDADLLPKLAVRSPRRVFDRPVGLLFKGCYFVCRGLQVSEGGMLIGIDLALSAGDLVLLSLLLPSSGGTVVRAEILYRHALSQSGLPEFGLKFLNITVLARRSVRNYVSAKTLDEAELERSHRERKLRAVV